MHINQKDFNRTSCREEDQLINLIKEEEILFPLKGYNNNSDYQKAKTPAVKEWPKHKGVTDEEYERLIDNKNWLGLAIKRTTVVDIDQIVNKKTGEIIQDGHQVGKLLLNLLKSENYFFHAIETPNGYQFIFKHTEGLNNSAKNVTPLGVITDYRVKDKGYIVYPTENTDNRYFVHKSDKELSEVPPFIKAMKQYNDNIKFLPKFPILDGSRNDNFNRWLFEVKNFFEGDERRRMVTAIGQTLAKYMCDVPYDDEEDKRHLQGTIESVLSKENRDITPKSYTMLINRSNEDKGTLYGDDLKFELMRRRNEELEKLKAQHEAEEKKGEPPSKLSPLHTATVLIEYIEFGMFDDADGAKLAMYLPEEGIYTQKTLTIYKHISWLEPTLAQHAADAVIFHLKNRTDIKELTKDRYLIAVNNGVYNLRTKTLEPFSPNYVFTSKVDTNYIDNPTPPNIDGWTVDDFISSISCNDEGIINLLWEVIADALNGNFSREQAIFLVGETTSNGKGTFQELLINMIGMKNVASLKINEFDGEKSRFALGALEGRTVVIGDDNPEGYFIDDASRFKSVVTGDLITIERKNKDPYATHFNGAVIQSTNKMPRFRSLNDSIFRRMVIVPFENRFLGSNKNRDIKDDYIKRKDVLEYVMYKALQLDFERFSEPKASIAAKEQYHIDNDPLKEFKVNEFDNWNIDEVPKDIVFDAYEAFCFSSGYKPKTRRKFYADFEREVQGEWESGEGQKRFKKSDFENANINLAIPDGYDQRKKRHFFTKIS
ncbi:phage/plasmid primase, P4 family [Jeotgalicoccus sp. S0W5]|uniref:phage/plasmid primase, P4 family n=1 Tax=Jeotgalicoccus sp. S0W5 TaxID=2527874 RepID=UPI0014152CFA|nr:phage/plasmid primase, P4 family [Jeotgalicoccus sp. S0W5]